MARSVLDERSVEHGGAVAGEVGVTADREAEAWRLRRSDAEWALRVAETLRDEAAAAGDDVARGRALTIVGACHVARNDFLAALRALLEARPALEGAPPVDRARALGEAGMVDSTLGDHASAIEQLADAHRLYERIGDRVGRADTLNRIGVVFFSHGDLDEAQRAYECSLDLRTADDDPLAVAGTRNNLAKVLAQRGDHDRALEHLHQARACFTDRGESRGVGMTLHNEAVVHEERGDQNRAISLLRQAIEAYDVSGHVHGACESRSRLGALLAAADEIDAAQAALERAHHDAEQRGLGHECVRAAAHLADVHEARGDHARALTWLRHVRGVERRLFDEASEQRLRVLQVHLQLERLERVSVTDGLTGLLNRRGLDGALADRVDRSRRNGGELALLMLDLDDFKRVNDEFSHTVGDEVLRAIAMILRGATRPTDVCARFGGEEFVVVLPGCDRQRAGRVAHDLVARVRAHPWSEVSDGLRVTTSIGVATLSEVTDPALLLDAADRGLYAAKHGGKDRVRGVA